MTQEGFKRKLTAILSADAVGYSRLIGDDETAAGRTLTTYRNEISSLIKQHNDPVIDSPGDNLPAEFIRQCESLEDQTATADVVETYVPIMKDDVFVGAFEIYYDIYARTEATGQLS